MEKTSGVYKITNKITGDFYIGSSKNISRRWSNHKCQSTWKCYPNKKMYLDMEKYGLKNFDFEIIEETTDLKNREQYFIDLLKPSYNEARVFGHDLDKYKLSNKKANRRYHDMVCEYNGKKIRLFSLMYRFIRKGIPNPMSEARKYLIEYN